MQDFSYSVGNAVRLSGRAILTSEDNANRFDTLVARASDYQELAKDNYDRVRRIAEGVRSGLCNFLNSADGICVRLVPPTGPFQPKDYGDEAFSMPPRGFRHIAPIAFGLAVRVTRGTDWMRMTVVCAKQGHNFLVSIADGPSAEFDLPFTDEDHNEFYELIYRHIMTWFDQRMEIYSNGEYGSKRAIGFDFSDENEPGDGIAPDEDILVAGGHFNIGKAGS